jgi:3-oxoadipate enol-lactonase/4-carboxymuconolactone decarboxylase
VPATGPSCPCSCWARRLGTSATTLWSQCAAGLADAFDLTAWDLPGHGYNHTVPDEPFTMAELAAGVLQVVDDVLAERGDVGGSFLYAGVSVGGAVGLQLMLDQPDRVTAAALLCTGAKIGDQALWAERMSQVGASGHAAHRVRLRRALVRPRIPRPQSRGRLRAPARAAADP